MKRPSYVLRLLAGMAIIVAMFAALSVPAAAGDNPGPGDVAVWDHETWPSLFGAIESDVANGLLACFSDIGGDGTIMPGGPLCDGSQEVYFASVVNGDEDGEAFPLGAHQTSVTVQNLGYDDAYAFFYVGNGDGWDQAAVTYLSAGASKTFTAADLGIEGGPVPVVAALYHVLVASVDCVEQSTGGFLCSWTNDSGETFTWLSPRDISEAFGIGAYAAGVAKQAVGASNLPYTTTATVSVSGYNAVSGREVGFFDQLYFPIVQSNCGPGGCWTTRLRIAHVGQDPNAAVTVRFFPNDDASGSLDTGFQLQALVNVGETWTIIPEEWGVPQGWVGSAHVFSDDAVVAIADRVKVGTMMWITNTASNAAAELYWQVPGLAGSYPYALFAPDVRMDFNAWNTGINVANTVDVDNNVNIQYFGNNGNAPQGQSRRIAAHGMTYFYNPSDPTEDDCEQPASQVPTCDFVGGAIILSDFPVTVAVDGVKYYGDANDQNIGQAFTYAATGNVYDWQAMPLVQKGNPSTGMGATSGINFMNPNAGATMVEVDWINPSGFAADNFGQSMVWVPGYSTGFVYTMFQHNLPNGFFGSAIVESELPISATSANVDYQVQYDGTVVWNLYNPCGFFRQLGDCEFDHEPEPPGDTGQIIKTVVDEDGNVVAGAEITVTGESLDGTDYTSVLVTNAAGQASFIVPAGTYDIEITDVPGGYAIDPDTAIDADVEISAGENFAITNPVLNAPAIKTIDTAKPGALICAFGPGGTDQDPKAPPVAGDCYQGFTIDKTGGTGGQGDPDDFAALFSQGGASITVDYGQNVVTVDIEASGLPANEEISVVVLDSENCATADLDDETIWFDETGTVDGVGVLRYTTVEVSADDPDLEAGYVIVLVDENGDIIDCGLIEAGVLVPMTPEEIAETVGAAAVVIADEEGDAVFELEPGCYIFVAVHPNHQTFTSEVECLEAGEVRTNTIQIEPIIGTQFGTLFKTFVDSEGDPVPFLIVTIYDAEGDNIEFFGPTDTDGEIQTVLPVGDYTLCWEDEAGVSEGDSPAEEGFYIGGCEVFSIEAGETTVLLNVVEEFSVLDVCVRDSDLDVALPGALVELFTIDGVYLGSAITDANGEASFFVDVDEFFGTDFLVTATADGYEAQSATVYLANAEDPDEDCDGGVGGDVDISLDPFGLGAFAELTKTVVDGATGEPVFGATVVAVLFDGTACPTTFADAIADGGVAASTDENGEAVFFLLGDTDYCILVTDVDGNVVSEDIVSVPANTTDAVTNTLTVTGIADVFNASVAGDPGDSLYVFLSSPTDQLGFQSGAVADDQATAAGFCQGPFVGSFPFDAGTGEAQFTATAGVTYCIAADASDGTVYEVQHLSVPAGDADEAGASVDAFMAD